MGSWPSSCRTRTSAKCREQAAALTQVTSEVYYEKQEGNVIPVKRVSFRLADKRAPLMNLARTVSMWRPGGDGAVVTPGAV